MVKLGEFINTYILWIIPIVTIILTFVLIIVSTPDNEHISIKDLLSIGVNLCISAITILITNYKSETTDWLILFFFFIISLVIAIVCRKFMWSKSNFFKIIACILFFIIGMTLVYVAIEHAIDNIQSMIT